MVATVIEHEHDHEVTGWKRWVFSTNHKDIGSMYLIFAIIAGIIGGIMSLIMRTELSAPDDGILNGDYQMYNVLTTAHGLIMIFFIDLENFIIPDSLNFTIMGLALLKNFLPNFNTSLIHEINQSIIGGMVGYSSIWLIIFLYKTFKKIDGMGLGDAKLMAGIGLLFGWQSIPFVLFVSAILGLIFVLPSLLNKQKNMRSEIPFGPFIIVACLIYFAQGDLLYSLILV